jgi:DNA-binding NarL/FixJ family response regulator/tetratricopeptide (TPR) repeat protein
VQALTERGATAVERAHHVECSARRGDLTAVAVLREAGEAAARRAPAAAARLFEGALRLLPADAPPAQRVELMDMLVGAQVAVGLLTEPHALMLESLELRRDAPLEVRVRLTAALASLENLLGRHKEAHSRLVTALEDLPDSAFNEAVALLIQLAVDSFYRMEYASMREFAERAADSARPLDHRSLTAGALGLLALAEVFSGEVKEAEATCSEGAALVDSMPDDELARSRRAINNLAPAELYLGRYEEAGTHAERALSVAYATGQGQFVPTLFWTGVSRMVRGRLPEAAEILDTAVEIARLSGHAQGIAWNLGGRSLAASAAGDVEAALAAAEEAVESLEGHERSFPAVWAGLALATALLPAGHPERAVQVLLDSAGGEELPALPVVWRPAALELQTRCELELGRQEGAAHAAARAKELAEALGLPMAAAMADRAAAAVALDAGDAPAASERALESAATAAGTGAVVEAALARMLAGRALAAAGEKERAAAELEGAAAELEACGAFGHRDEAERLLGKLGRRPHRRSRPGRPGGSGIESLTERELEVARLVVDRKTNAQIAAELFLSQKTVESHIRHLFQKLDVSSRVEVARVVERAERQAAPR